MLRWIVLTMLLVPCVAFAADFWDGNAALQRGDAAFEGGLNVASNSFPPGTQITIQDEDTGKTVTATVTGRIEGQSDILLLMSPKTAEAARLARSAGAEVALEVSTEYADTSVEANLLRIAARTTYAVIDPATSGVLARGTREATNSGREKDVGRVALGAEIGKDVARVIQDVLDRRARGG